MQNKTQLLLLMSVLLFSHTIYSDDISPSELSDGPQTLSTVKSEPTPTPLPTSVLTPLATPTTLKEGPDESLKKSSVVSEEQLLESTNSSSKENDENKIKTAQVTDSEIYIQEADKYKLTETYKDLHLNDAIEQGLRKNYDQNIRVQQDTLNEITFQGAKNAFWLPELKINLTTNNQRISTLHSNSDSSSTSTPTTPTGILGLSLGDYTVFNWGKDYALYLNKQSTYHRNKKILEESKRELKLDLIQNYFLLITNKNKEKIRQDQLRQASFIYRLNKEKITLKKISKQEYYLARSEYLKAQNDYHQEKIANDISHENLAYLIADELGTKYILTETLDYRKIKITLEEALGLALKNNPNLLNNKTSIENAERNYDVALKENMPLPKFTINLGAYDKHFGPTTNQTIFETSGGGGNVELVASINATWSLTGADGLFNSNKLAIGHIGKELAFKEHEKNSHMIMSMIRQTYKNILSLQNQIVILEARLPSLQKTFDTILDNYLNGKTKYTDFHLILQEITETKILYEQYKLDHLNEKLHLAKLTGLEDFPGENFEQLAIEAMNKEQDPKKGKQP